MSAASGRPHVLGVGMTPLTRDSGLTTLELAVRAARAACTDAGVARDAIDGVLTYHLGDSDSVVALCGALGLAEIGWHNEYYGGGSQSASILGDAASVIEAGLASTVLVYRALNGRSGARMGQTSLRLADRAEQDFVLPHGVRGPVNAFAMVATRLVGTGRLDERVLSRVVRDSRAKARHNPEALRREGMTEQEYLASPFVAEPLRRADCCQETDGAVAFVVTRAGHAPEGGRRRVRIRGAVRAGGLGSSHPERSADATRMFSAYVAPRLYELTGTRPGDVDLVQLYDAYSFLVPVQLEDFGLVGAGEFAEAHEAGLFERSGALPMNLNGGLLSEGYVHGLNNVAAAVRLLRGDAPYAPDLDRGLALCTGFGGSYGSALLLEAD